MKTIKTLLLAIVMVAGMSLPAAAQFRFGVRAGVAVNDLHLDMKTFDGDNRAGFTGGLMAEFTVPVIGVGLVPEKVWMETVTRLKTIVIMSVFRLI